MYVAEAVKGSDLMKKVVLEEVSQNSQKNTCARVFFNNNAGLRLATLLKKKLWHWCFL